MSEYHKIQTVFKRNPETKFKTLLEGDYSLPEFEYLANNEWVFTEKVDGTNIRVIFNGENVSFGGRTDAAQIPAFLIQRLQERFLTIKVRETFKEKFSGGVILYGEGYGAKIQKGGGNYRSDQDFVLFDVKIGDFWLARENVAAVANSLGIDVVPAVGIGNLSQMVEMARCGFRSKWGDFPAEGIVARPTVELKTRLGHRIITKIKIKDFIREEGK